MVKPITLASISKQMERGFSAVADDIADLRQELKGDIIELRVELKGDIADLRSELKGDIADLRQELKGDIGRLSEQLTSIESELRDIKRRLALLEESVAGMKGFAKEIDALNDRVRAIEKHLGISKKIAA